MQIGQILLTIVLPAVVSLIVGLTGGYFYRKNVAEEKVERAEESVRKMIVDSQKRA